MFYIFLSQAEQSVFSVLSQGGVRSGNYSEINLEMNLFVFAHSKRIFLAESLC